MSAKALLAACRLMELDMAWYEDQRRRRELACPSRAEQLRTVVDPHTRPSHPGVQTVLEVQEFERVLHGCT